MDAARTQAGRSTKRPGGAPFSGMMISALVNAIIRNVTSQNSEEALPISLPVCWAAAI
jgi:hypothetical protein